LCAFAVIFKDWLCRILNSSYFCSHKQYQDD
jgi:hypothetical protein